MGRPDQTLALRWDSNISHTLNLLWIGHELSSLSNHEIKDAQDSVESDSDSSDNNPG